MSCSTPMVHLITRISLPWRSLSLTPIQGGYAITSMEFKEDMSYATAFASNFDVMSSKFRPAYAIGGAVLSVRGILSSANSILLGGVGVENDVFIGKHSQFRPKNQEHPPTSSTTTTTTAPLSPAALMFLLGHIPWAGIERIRMFSFASYSINDFMLCITKRYILFSLCCHPGFICLVSVILEHRRPSRDINQRNVRV